MPNYENGLLTLLELHGTQMYRDDGYMWKIEAWQVNPSRERPHGIRYNLTLHDKYNTRVLGFDNTHAVKPLKKSKITGKRRDFDHVHRTPSDKGIPYEFESAKKLLEDFFNKIEEVIEVREGKG